MPKRYWKYGIAALFAVLTIFGSAWLPYNLQHQSEREDARKAESYVTGEYIRIRCGSLPAAERALCAAQQVDALAEAKRAEHDLKAQQEMAEWAWLILVATVLGLFVSAGGLIALVWTFREQRKLTQNQSRAYLELVRAHFDVVAESDDGQDFHIRLRVKNNGETPADVVRVDMVTTFYPETDEIGQPSADAINVSLATIGIVQIPARGTYTILCHGTARVPWPKINASTWRYQPPRIDVIGSLVYLDVFSPEERLLPIHLEGDIHRSFAKPIELWGTHYFRLDKFGEEDGPDER